MMNHGLIASFIFSQRYLEIVKTIRRYVPDAAITADVIVGFPGETEEQFLNTLKLMEEVKFDQVYYRAYSPRPNTPAGNVQATFFLIRTP